MDGEAPYLGEDSESEAEQEGPQRQKKQAQSSADSRAREKKTLSQRSMAPLEGNRTPKPSEVTTKNA
jgi:hypothetical protein